MSQTAPQTNPCAQIKFCFHSPINQPTSGTFYFKLQHFGLGTLVIHDLLPVYFDSVQRNASATHRQTANTYI